jgi:hypothetical protein
MIYPALNELSFSSSILKPNIIMGRQINLTPWLFSEQQIVAQLLGLTLKEYLDLSHSGLREVRDFNDTVLYYYIVVSPLNAETTLAKLKMTKSRIIYLPPDYMSRKGQVRSLSQK